MRSHMKIFPKSSKNSYYPQQRYGADRVRDIKKISLRVLMESLKIYYQNLF